MESLLSTYKRSCFNFNAGPAVLPLPVLEKMKDELLDYQGTGMSVMEMSHRSKEFVEILEAAKQKAISLLNIPENYEVLFVPGGARTQFSMIPLNLALKGKPAQIIHTGSWTKQAISEHAKCCEYEVIATSEEKNFTYIPKEFTIDSNASYLYLCANNTIFGTQWKEFPETGDIPLIADMTSEIFSRPLDISKFGVIYASAQKNLGIAGITIVIIRKDLIERAPKDLPTMLQYRDHVKANSLLNTAPTFPIYVSKLVLDWIESEGGLEAIDRKNQEKAKLLYDVIDGSDFYDCPVAEEDRSLMNVVFRINNANEETEAEFLKEAEALGLKGLKGHRSVGGLRASIYNAQPIEGIEALANLMKDFESRKK